MSHMNFFEQQDQAKRRTTWLILLFVLAVACVALSFYGLALFVLVPQAQDRGKQGAEVWWDPLIFMQITGAACLLIFLGAGAQRLRLGSSGKSVAEALGGQPLLGSTENHDEKILRNVVDEMALASGMPVPPIYILEENSINAFAAGKNPQDAVLGFTRGAIAQLNREELQGVAAHEFSHIAHQDTRLNLRIACVVAGIMFIALIGRVMLQVGGRIATSTRGSSKKNDSAGAALVIVAAGVGLLVVGSIGALFGRLLQAAVSRQREFLADASAVQYSRNPSGIANALRRIGGVDFMPIQSPAASGLSHFFFSKSMHSWLSTHPPLPERIRRIEQGGFVAQVIGESSPSAAVNSGGSNSSNENVSGVAGEVSAAFMASEAVGVSGRANTTRTTSQPLTRAKVFEATMSKDIAPESFHKAHDLLLRIPAAVQHATNEPLDVQAVLLLLVTGTRPEMRESVRAITNEQLGEAMVACWDRLASSMLNLTDEMRLAVLDLCVPTLTQLSKQQYVAFRTTLTAAMRSDGRVDLFEWMTRTVLTRRIETRFGAMSTKKPARSLRECSKEIRIVLGTLARAGGSNHGALAFDSALTKCGLNGLSFPAAIECDLNELHFALEGLDTLVPRDRKLLAGALVTVASADNAYTTQELLLLRAFAYRLDIHLPLLVI